MKDPHELLEYLPREWWDEGERIRADELGMDLKELTRLVIVDWLPREAVRSVFELFQELPWTHDKSQKDLADQLGISRATWNRYKELVAEDRLLPLDKTPNGNLVMAMVVHLALSSERPTFAEVVFRTVSVVVRRIKHELIDGDDVLTEFNKTTFTRVECAALHYYLRHPDSPELDPTDPKKVRVISSVLFAIVRYLRKDFPKANVNPANVHKGIVEYLDAYLLFCMAFHDRQWGFFK